MSIYISSFSYLNQWDDDLSECPSQCQRPFEFHGQVYDLYLRWRWSDPWQGHVILRTGVIDLFGVPAKSGRVFNSQDEWSPDLFEAYGLKWDQDELESAKLSLDQWANKFLRAPDWMPRLKS